MAKFYKIPIFVGGWGTCSKAPDVQAGYEKAFSAFICYLSGADITSGPGLLENWTVLSFEQLLIDHEMFTMMADMLKGFPVDKDSMPLDVIAKVGHEGHFMGEKHTLDHFRRDVAADGHRRADLQDVEGRGIKERRGPREGQGDGDTQDTSAGTSFGRTEEG